jgi:tetratricopeptide (TPR) repeat protein
MKTLEQIKQEAEAAFERGKNYHERKEYDMAIKEYSKAIKLDPSFAPAYNKRSELDPYYYRQNEIQGKCSFCGLPAALAHDLIDVNNKKICGKCINKPEELEIIKEIKQNNKIFYEEIMFKIFVRGCLEMVFLCFGTRWLTDFTIEELRIKAREYEKPKRPEPILINNIPIHKNQNTELLDGEIFKKHLEKNVEVSNLGRVKQNDCVLEQYDPKNNGYLFIDIKSTRKTIPEKVYRLVAETWLERPDIKEQPKVQKNECYNTVHHISNNGYDNRIENLMWVTEWQHAMIHPWMDINNFNFEELNDLFYSYAYINITPDDYQRIIAIAKRMQQLENAESKFPGKFDYWYENIIEAMEELIKRNFSHSITP